jgi:hypothetical protein
MSVNKSKPHVLVLPEDDANRQIANGFQLEVASRQLQILVEAGGWTKVLESFATEHIRWMEQFQNRFMVLVIDLDNRDDRHSYAAAKIPAHLTDRVFILSTLTEPEKLKDDLGTYETIGLALAKDCRDGIDKTWSHKLLRHNADEVRRLNEPVRPILFP